MASGGGKDPWAWLGLLKWSLSYSDGTRDTPVSPMSDEDKAFLEEVMKDGIIDENERMRFILGEATRAMEHYQRKSTLATVSEEKTPDDMDGSDNATPPPTTEELVELLQELRDIVEQIDYARAFCSLQGLPFLLGCASAKDDVPSEIRTACISIVSTLAQNNPPVQEQLLHLGALKTISDIYFTDEPPMQARCMQSISSIVRNHELAEGVFEKLEQGPQLLLSGLQASSNAQLQSRTLLFLRAFLTSDTTTAERVRAHAASIAHVLDHYIMRLGDGSDVSTDIYEQSISFVQQILNGGKDTAVIASRHKPLVAHGVERIASLRKQTKGGPPPSSDDDATYEYETAKAQLELWEALLLALSNITP